MLHSSEYCQPNSTQQPALRGVLHQIQAGLRQAGGAVRAAQQEPSLSLAQSDGRQGDSRELLPLDGGPSLQV